MDSWTERTTEADRVRVFHGDSRAVLKAFPDDHFDSVVCDPPYALVSITKRFGADDAAPAQVGASGAYARASAGFMGQKWDTGETAFAVEFWAEVMRVLKPGGHVIAFSGTRTYHRLAVAIEDAGFEIRDMVAWLYGSGFPKSHDVSKGIDKMGPPDQAPFAEFAAHYETQRKAKGLTHAKVCAAGGWHGAVNHGGSSVNWANGYGMPTVEQWAVLQPLLGLDKKWGERVQRVQYEREVLGLKPGSRLAVAPGQENDRSRTDLAVTAAGSDAARQWQGWGTALKPAWESVCFGQKPYALPQLCGIVAHKVAEALCQLPSYAKDAEPSSSSSPSGFDGAFASAPWNAVAGCNTPDDLFALMDTWPSELAPPSNLSTAFSWLRTLAAISRHGSTFTTETASSLTTDLRTLKSLLSKNTLDTMAQAVTPQNGTSPDASLVRSLFSVAEARLLCIQGLSAVDPATLTEDAPGLRPNLDPCVLARKPLESTVAGNVLKHGTGALNIDASRIGLREERELNRSGSIGYGGSEPQGVVTDGGKGRWPANVIHDGSEEVVGAFPDSASGSGARPADSKARSFSGVGCGPASHDGFGGYDDAGAGSAARFFYSAKADAEDRLGSRHPTVKPVDLMAYLVRLVTPPGGLTLDPFAGSGTTGVAAMRGGFRAVLIEREDAYVEDIVRKLAWARGEGALTSLEMAKLDTPEAQAKAAGADLPLFG